MESVLWAVVLYFIVKRWLRKNPDALKNLFSENTALKASAASKNSTARVWPTPTAAPVKSPRVTSTSHTEAKLPKKREKQFQEL